MALTLGEVLARIHIDSAYTSTERDNIIAAITQLYSGSSLARTMFDQLASRLRGDLEIVKRTDEFGFSERLDELWIDPSKQTGRFEIDQLGRLVPIDFKIALLHELSHALNGFKDPGPAEWLFFGTSSADYFGANVVFENAVRTQLGVASQRMSYENGISQFELPYRKPFFGTSYTNGATVDLVLRDNGATADGDPFKAGVINTSTLLSPTRDLLIDVKGRESKFYSGNGNDFLYGFALKDILDGGGGHDWLFGGTGEDSLYGGPGNDFLYGGMQNDKIWTGAGSDKVVGERNGGTDTIMDFDAVRDFIDMRSFTNLTSHLMLTFTESADGVRFSFGGQTFVVNNASAELVIPRLLLNTPTYKDEPIGPISIPSDAVVFQYYNAPVQFKEMLGGGHSLFLFPLSFVPTDEPMLLGGRLYTGWVGQEYLGSSVVDGKIMNMFATLEGVQKIGSKWFASGQTVFYEIYDAFGNSSGRIILVSVKSGIPFELSVNNGLQTVGFPPWTENAVHRGTFDDGSDYLISDFAVNALMRDGNSHVSSEYTGEDFQFVDLGEGINICGLKGDAKVIGGNGIDSVEIRSGSIYGFNGNDTLNLDGAGLIVGGLGNDSISAGRGQLLVNLFGTATLRGGEGNDIIGSGKIQANLFGDAGRDVLIGSGSIVNFTGGTGNDELHLYGDYNLCNFREANWGYDQVFSFNGGVDQIRISRALADSFSDLTITGNGTNRVVLSLAGQRIAFEDFDNGPYTFTASDFIFG